MSVKHVYQNARRIKPSANLVAATPEARFSYDAVTFAPTVHFFNESVGATSHEWDFGDGSPTSNEVSPVHTYSVTTPESFTVRLTVNASVFVEAIITVEDPNPPPAQLSGQTLTTEEGANMTTIQGAEMLV